MFIYQFYWAFIFIYHCFLYENYSYSLQNVFFVNIFGFLERINWIYIIFYGKYCFSFRTFVFRQTFLKGLITKTEAPLYINLGRSN